MHIESESSFDVVVVGGGIAGCCAAIEAARAGASVCLASASGVFSGSSFYPGTWGLGLVGPRDASDIDDMVEAILHVGRGVANAALVDSFVRGIPEAIAALEAMGVSLKRPANPDEPQYIPCFDRSLRMWRGLERASMERGFGRALCEGGVVRFDGCELLDFAMEACGDEGMEIACDVGDGSPEFVRTFSGWLERECGVSASAPARIAPYAHASNGGIAIDEYGSCGVPGLFAAGECTGGMHGADRIGGLASANALVFGRRAGVAAAKFSRGFVGERAGGGANARSETSGFASVGTLASGCGLDVGSCRDSDAEGIATKSDSHNGRCAGGLSFPVALWVGFV